MKNLIKETINTIRDLIASYILRIVFFVASKEMSKTMLPFIVLGADIYVKKLRPKLEPGEKILPKAKMLSEEIEKFLKNSDKNVMKQ